jgi:hypothetical protein
MPAAIGQSFRVRLVPEFPLDQRMLSHIAQMESRPFVSAVCQAQPPFRYCQQPAFVCGGDCTLSQFDHFSGVLSVIVFLRHGVESPFSLN